MKATLHFKQFIDLLKHWVAYVISVHHHKDYQDKIKIKVHFRPIPNTVNK